VYLIPPPGADFGIYGMPVSFRKIMFDEKRINKILTSVRNIFLKKSAACFKKASGGRSCF